MPFWLSCQEKRLWGNSGVTDMTALLWCSYAERVIFAVCSIEYHFTKLKLPNQLLKKRLLDEKEEDEIDN